MRLKNQKLIAIAALALVVLGIEFIGLKLLNIVDWSWGLTFALFMALFAAIIIVTFVLTILER